jgi:hypothetical protein
MERHISRVGSVHSAMHCIPQVRTIVLRAWATINPRLSTHDFAFTDVQIAPFLNIPKTDLPITVPNPFSPNQEGQTDIVNALPYLLFTTHAESTKIHHRFDSAHGSIQWTFLLPTQTNKTRPVQFRFTGSLWYILPPHHPQKDQEQRSKENTTDHGMNSVLPELRDHDGQLLVGDALRTCWERIRMSVWDRLPAQLQQTAFLPGNPGQPLPIAANQPPSKASTPETSMEVGGDMNGESYDCSRCALGVFQPSFVDVVVLSDPALRYHFTRSERGWTIEQVQP